MLRQTRVLHQVGSSGHVVRSVAFGMLNVDELFFLLGWDEYGFYKKRDGTHHAKLVLLHPMGYAGHVVHSAASGKRNIDALFFMIGWDHNRFQKQRVETRYAELVFRIRWDLRVT
jgi:hypothetical protein